ncbi:MAG TPA: YhfC family intramembrane metalloprotease [Clostridiales bacterium]|jgi:uncharacterized membrane protein YhfC|nr:YhfC family intramembrane metalloprotease [Clostridiales bacterium]
MKRIAQNPFAWFVLGMLCFLISQPLIRIPLLGAAAQTMQFTIWQIRYPIGLIIVIALSAGLFEETARWLFRRFLLWPRDNGAAQPLIFGLGHGFMEVLYFFVPAWTMMLASGSWSLALTERALAMIAHVFFTFLIWDGFRRQKPFRYWLIAVLLHGLIDILAGLSGLYRWSVWQTEGLFAIYDIFAIIYIVWSVRNRKRPPAEEFEPSYPEAGKTSGVAFDERDE